MFIIILWLTHSCTHTYLSQWDVVKVSSIKSEAELPADSLHIFEGIHTRTEDEEHWSGRTCLFVGHLKWYGPFLDVFGTQLLFNVKSMEENCTKFKSQNNTLLLWEHNVKPKTHTHMHTHTHARMHARTHTHTHTCTCICTCTSVCSTKIL